MGVFFYQMNGDRWEKGNREQSRKGQMNNKKGKFIQSFAKKV